MGAPPLKTVFLDYDTVSNGDLDLAALREAAGDLSVYDSSDTKIAERLHDADVALLNKLELTRELLWGAPQSGRVPLYELLATADILSLHCPLNDATRGMIGARELALMKPDALLINTARGALIDGPALAAALKAGRLGGAGIDVLPQEPPVQSEPLLDGGIPNLLVTPHIAWAAREARQRCIDEMAANIRDFQSGGRRGRVV